MSTRAYKVKKIELEEESTFNISQEFYWIEQLATSIEYNESSECRWINFERQTIKQEINDIKRDISLDRDKPINEYQLKVLKKVLQDMGENGVLYECY